MNGAGRQDRLRAAFHEAVERDVSGREQSIASLRAEDPELALELAALLAESERFDELPDAPAWDANYPSAGSHLGPYVLVREIGSGGMGTVFEAIRGDDGFRQTVAIKILHYAAGFQRRFREERRALGQLEHPNIARLIDWGTGPSGQSYLVMEHVRDALPIDRYCLSKELDSTGILTLFRSVCAAVAHAHRNLIVHRDLKPANILVTASGEVKLLDFGIAKILDSGDSDTVTGGGRMTPAYASPEQLSGEPVTTASDVYSLGVVLYELLAGVPPFKFVGARLDAAVQVVTGSTPLLPSRVGTISRQRRSELTGDLDNIVMMALHREPARRYGTVEQFVGDLESFQSGRPVSATADSTIYRLRRFVLRNRASAGLAALALFAMVAGTAVSTWKGIVAEHRYQSVRGFAHVVLTTVGNSGHGSLTEDERALSSEALKHLTDLGGAQTRDDELQMDLATAHERLADSYGLQFTANLGDADRALEHYRTARAILMSQWKARPDSRRGEQLIRVTARLGLVLPDPAPAAELMAGGLQIGSQLLTRNPGDVAVLQSITFLHQIRGNRLRSSGDLDGALAEYRLALSYCDRVAAIQPGSSWEILRRDVNSGEAALVLRMEGHLDAALAGLLETYERTMAAVPNPNRQMQRQFGVREQLLGMTLRVMKQYSRAAPYLRRCIQRQETLARQDRSDRQAPYDLAVGIYHMGELEFDEGHTDRAMASHREALRIRKGLAEHDPHNIPAQLTYAISLNRVSDLVLASQRDGLAEAEAGFSEATSVSNRIREQAPSDVYVAAQLALSYRGQAEAARRSPGKENRERATKLFERSMGVWADIRKRCPLDVSLAAQAEATRVAYNQLGK